MPGSRLPQPTDTDNSVTTWATGDESASPTQAQVGTSYLPVGEQSAFGATTSVDTISIDSFIAYIESLVTPLEQGRDSLADVNVQPGAFTTADAMRTKINGSGGLAGQFETILTDLVNGVVSISQAMTELRTTYTDTEALNHLSASALSTQFQEAEQYFSNLISDAGGSSGSTGTSGATGSSSPSGS